MSKLRRWLLEAVLRTGSNVFLQAISHGIIKGNPTNSDERADFKVVVGHKSKAFGRDIVILNCSVWWVNTIIIQIPWVKLIESDFNTEDYPASNDLSWGGISVHWYPIWLAGGEYYHNKPNSSVRDRLILETETWAGAVLTYIQSMAPGEDQYKRSACQHICILLDARH